MKSQISKKKRLPKLHIIILLFQVSNHGYMYSWVRDTLVPGVFSGPWYNDELLKYSGFIDNHESLLVSIPRLRQVRVKKGTQNL